MAYKGIFALVASLAGRQERLQRVGLLLASDI